MRVVLVAVFVAFMVVFGLRVEYAFRKLLAEQIQQIEDDSAEQVKVKHAIQPQ